MSQPDCTDSSNGSRRGEGSLTRIKCQGCAVRTAALCSEVGDECANALGRAFHRRRVPAGQVIYSSDQKSKVFAVIISGVVKLTNVRPDGRQQIVGLQFPADFVGRPYLGTSNLLAEAASNLELCCFSGDAFESIMHRHPELEGALLKRTLDSLDNAREWMFMLGRKTAHERVASLILMIAERMTHPSSRKEPLEICRFESPLSRTEMADCLGLRLETVSRQLAVLKQRGVLASSRNRTFDVRSMSELRRWSESPAE
jgi:CRP/FNR family transcriptional regulator